VSAPLRVAFIGAGRIADLHALGYASNPDASIAGVCDSDAAWAAKRAEEWGAGRSATDYRDVLTDGTIDAVEILTPHHLHCEMTVAALEAGKHVSVQKPMALDLAEADRMVDTAGASGRVFRVFENFRYYPPYRRVREMIAAGVIGDPISMRVKVIGGDPKYGWDVPLKAWAWRVNEAQSGGGPAIFDHGYHVFSLVMWLFGEVDEVYAWIGRTVVAPGVEFDSPALIFWKHRDGGRFGSWETVNTPQLMVRSRYYSNDEWLEITGTRGVLWVTTCTGDMLGLPPIVLYRDGQTTEIMDVQSDWSSSFVAATRDWIRAVCDGGPQPEIGAWDAREVLRFSLAAHLSARENRPVRVADVQ
jgi:predicted dehydrogenase